MKYVRIDAVARDRVAHLVVVAEDPAAVLRDAARSVDAVMGPAARPTRAEVRRPEAAERPTSSERACAFVARGLGHLIRHIGARMAR
ncbi:MAG: hypothetical protein U1A78_30505 [Polyangia bacterium]